MDGGGGETACCAPIQRLQNPVLGSNDAPGRRARAEHPWAGGGSAFEECSVDWGGCSAATGGMLRSSSRYVGGQYAQLEAMHKQLNGGPGRDAPVGMLRSNDAPDRRAEHHAQDPAGMLRSSSDEPPRQDRRAEHHAPQQDPAGMPRSNDAPRQRAEHHAPQQDPAGMLRSDRIGARQDRRAEHPWAGASDFGAADFDSGGSFDWGGCSSAGATMLHGLRLDSACEASIFLPGSIFDETALEDRPGRS